MKIRLDKAFIVRAYCYTLQAERSLHKASGNDWSALLEFYSVDRRKAIQDVINHLTESLTNYGLRVCQVHRDEIQGGGMGFLRWYFGKWIANWKTHWLFSPDDLSLHARSLQEFLKVLQFATRPDMEKLISLRMDLCHARSTYEYRCHGLPVFDRISEIEHLYQAPWMKPITIEDLLGDRRVRAPERKAG